MTGTGWEPTVTAFGHTPDLWPVLTARLAEFGRPVTVWSAGAQLGCETWTLAMHVHEAGLAGRVRIIASDMKRERLAIARRGEYVASQVWTDVCMGRLSESLFRRYFESPASWFPGWGPPTQACERLRVSEMLRPLVEFIDEPVRVPDRVDAADVVMLRNAWVHIEPEERRILVQRLEESLPADGLVVFRNLHVSEVRAALPLTSHKRMYGRPKRGAAAALSTASWVPAVP